MTNKYSETNKLHEINERVYWLHRLIREHKEALEMGWVWGNTQKEAYRLDIKGWQAELDALTPLRDHMTRCERAFVDGSDGSTCAKAHQAFYDAYPELYVEWVVGYIREKNIAKDYDNDAYAKHLEHLDW